MDIVGTLLSAAQTLLAALQCSELQEILSIFGYKSQLDDLQRTVSAINAVLLDAEAKQELSHEAKHWLEELKGAVFEADDLLDEFVTLAEQKQLMEAGGSLSKKWPKNTTNVVNLDIETEGLYLRNKEHLQGLKFDFLHRKVDGDVDTKEARRLMEELQPHSKLKELTVRRYSGVRMPSWTTLLPNLVFLALQNCEELGYLPCLGNLRHLKHLKLEGLEKLEYIGISPSVLGSAEGVPFFASLEYLELSCLPKLKGWAGVGAGDDLLFLDDCENIQLQLRLCLSQLKVLLIEVCPELTCMPPCPGLKYLQLRKFNRRLRIINTSSMFCHDISCPSPSRSLFDPENSRSNRQWTVDIDDVAWLNSLPIEAFQGLERLAIKGQLDEAIGEAVESLEEVKEVFSNCSSSLQDLDIIGFDKLRSMPGALEHLTALKKLTIWNCPNVRLSEEREDGTPWRSLHHSLISLGFVNLPQLVNLPIWMQSLAALEKLHIEDCKTLESMPSWMSKLTSLSTLRLLECSDSLKKRCQKDPPGEDWPYIQHIKEIDVREDRC
ncbi:hypothetical protein SOVF_076260 [Spinacia oleracea]|nr:hypothetical protein SOVF_076260 [Spinacia oleracea]